MLLLFCLLAVAWSVRPVVLLHGMMATNNSMDDAASWIAHTFPGAYVANLDTGSRLGAIVADMNVLCAQVAELVRADPKLQGGFNAVGHSQGTETACLFEVAEVFSSRRTAAALLRGALHASSRLPENAQSSQLARRAKRRVWRAGRQRAVSRPLALVSRP
jgi:hypothetical protein